MCETLYGAAVRRMQSEALVNCAPLARAKGYPETPLDPPRQPVRLDELAMWRRYRQRRCYHGPVLNRASMVIDAAINGQGIALARTTLAAWDLINGRLVLPFPESMPLSKAYWVVCPKASAAVPKIATFRDWLLAEAAGDLRQLKRLAREQASKKATRTYRSDRPSQRKP